MCSFCLPRWNKKQILHPMFQDRTCLIAQSLCCHEFCMECSSLAERPKNGFWGFFIRYSVRGWNNFLSQVFVCPWQVAGTVHLLLHRVVWNSTAATLVFSIFPFQLKWRGEKNKFPVIIKHQLIDKLIWIRLNLTKFESVTFQLKCISSVFRFNSDQFK